MGVYEARQQGSITQIDDGGAGRDSAAADRLNFSIGDYNQAGRKQRTADAVEQPRCFDSPSCRLGIQNERKTQQGNGNPGGIRCFHRFAGVAHFQVLLPACHACHAARQA